MELYTKVGKRYKRLEDLEVKQQAYIGPKMAEGLWLVYSGHNTAGKTMVAKLSEIPSDPYTFAGVMVHQDNLAQFLALYKANYGKQKDNFGWGPSNHEMAVEILKYISRYKGVVFSDKLKDHEKPERKITLEL